MEKSSGTTSTVWSGWKWGEEDAANRERVEAGVEHAAHRTRAEIEDQRLSAGVDHYAALCALQARHDRSGTYDRDLHEFLLSELRFTLQVSGLRFS
jgi:hypothetical protein